VVTGIKATKQAISAVKQRLKTPGSFTVLKSIWSAIYIYWLIYLGIKK
jgi:hypothetical protein